MVCSVCLDCRTPRIPQSFRRFFIVDFLLHDQCEVEHREGTVNAPDTIYLCIYLLHNLVRDLLVRQLQPMIVLDLWAQIIFGSWLNHELFALGI